MRKYIQMIDPQQHGHYRRKSNQEFLSSKPQDEHARQQSREQDDNAESEKNAYRNIHMHNRSLHTLIKSRHTRYTVQKIIFNMKKIKIFHIIQTCITLPKKCLA